MARRSIPFHRTVVALVIASISLPAMAQQRDVRAQGRDVGDAQLELNHLLQDTASAQEIASMRASCALGNAPKLRAMIRSAGLDAASAAPWCVTVLTRAGRDRTLGYVRDPRTNDLTPAIAFDNGFVGAYLKREPLPAGAPEMAGLLAVADRCLGQQEPNTNLCTAVGQLLGARAARGEVIALR